MQLLNDSLTMRFNTLEKNIKSKSNSFYDSYLDLLETTIKYILDENNVEYDKSRTCGFLIKDDYIKSYFLYVLKLDDYTYNKIPDYIKKCNDHKHKKEKIVSIEAIVNYLKVYFDLINYYSINKQLGYIEFDASYFESIFGETERLNNEYKDEVSKLKQEVKNLYEMNELSKEDVKTYQDIIQRKDMELDNLDDQNQELQNQISLLKSIKINSLEEKLHYTFDNLRELGLTIKNNRIVKEILDKSNAKADNIGITRTEKAINTTINKTKDMIDDINKYTSTSKEELNRINEGLSNIIDSYDEIE